MPVYEIKHFQGAISDYEDRGLLGAFKFGYNLDVRKVVDSLTCQQALIDEGLIGDPSSSVSPSASASPSSSASPSVSPSLSPSASVSPSPMSASSSFSPSASRSPSASTSLSASISPSHSNSPSLSVSSALTSVFRDLILWLVPASDGNMYGFGNTGYIYKRTYDGTWSVVYKAASKIKGAIEKPSSGKTYLVWALDTELHHKELPGRSDWNDVDQGMADYPKTNLTSTDWHTMAVVGGSTMIANKSQIAMIGYDDSYTNEALDLIPGNIAKTIVERNGRSIIGTYRPSDTTKGINSAIDGEQPLSQVGDEGEIYYANMTDSMPVKRFPGGGKTNPGGVCNIVQQVNFFEWDQSALSWIDKKSVGNMNVFGVFGATSGYNGLYTYGRKDKNHPFVLNLEYQMNVTEIGAVASMNGVLFASYYDGVDFGVMRVDTTTKAIGVYEGLDFAAPMKNTEQPTTWEKVEVYMKPLPSGCSVELWYRMDKDGSFVQARTADDQLSYSTASGKKATFVINEQGDIYEPKLVLNPSVNATPEIHRIRTFFT